MLCYVKRSILVVIVAAALKMFSVVGISGQTARTASTQDQEKSSSGAQQQQRRVEGRSLVSTYLPPIRIKFDKAFRFVGSQSFILYENAQVEQFFFVAADHDRIKRMFMVQFEGYLPSNTYTYDYQINDKVKIGGLDFMYNPAVVNVPLFRKQYPNSDAGRAAAFLEAKGYRLEGADIMFERFVRLVDETRRNELLIIYYENLSSTGLTAADLSEKGRAAGQRDKIFQELLKRALKSFSILK